MQESHNRPLCEGDDQRSGVFDVSRSSSFFTRYVWTFIIKIRKQWNYLTLVWYQNSPVCNWLCVLFYNMERSVYKTANIKWICNAKVIYYSDSVISWSIGTFVVLKIAKLSILSKCFKYATSFISLLEYLLFTLLLF